MPSRHNNGSGSPRLAALKIVQRTLQGQDLQSALNTGLSSFKLSAEDAALCTRICYCYLRLKGRLEFILKELSNKKLAKQSSMLKYILGLGLFELLYLARVPDYATVSWYVQYCKKRLSPNLAPMVNAVLRRAAREKEQLLEPNFFRQGNPSQEELLARYYSCPLWLAGLWLHTLGRESCEKLLTESLQPPFVGLRVNQTLPESEQVLDLLQQDSALVRRQGFGLALERAPGSVPHLEEQGLLSRQSLASQLALMQLEPANWPLPVWDACAGHGGKAGLLLENGIHSLWVSDLSLSRLKQAKLELQRLHLPPRPMFAADVAQPAPLGQTPGTLLLDVPCSGLGVLSRRPDIKWKLRKKELKTLIRLQARMLSQAARILPPGGKLIYLTCTVNPRENQEQIQKLLQSGCWELARECPPDLDSGLREYFYAACLRRL
ncbi:MAG: RsmB/NOP family class I SAM-dependent RNA methyltransferase [Desulfohalobiaceae bacterium]